MLHVIATVGLVLSLAPAPWGGSSAARTGGATDPRALGRVVILPFLDRTGEAESNSERQKVRGAPEAGLLNAAAAMALVEARFRVHGIEYVRRAELAAALSTLKFAPAREGERTPARLKALANALDASLVVTGIIQKASSDWQRRGVMGEGTAEATVQLQLFDARTGKYASESDLTATVAARAKQAPTRSAKRIDRLRLRVVGEATDKALAPFLKPYPPLYDEDPGEDFIVYESRPKRETVAASADAARAATTPAIPTKTVLFRLVGGGTVEGKIQKYEYGIYTVMTEAGKVAVAREYVLSMTEKP